MRVININQTAPYRASNYKQTCGRKKAQNAQNFSTLTFKGNKNKNQAAFISFEMTPVSNSSENGELMGALPSELNKLDMDTRVFIPLLNPKNSLKRDNGENYTYTNENNQTFNLKDTGLKDDVSFGLKKDKARLFKVEDKNIKAPLYMVYLENSLNLGNNTISEQNTAQSAFCTAAVNLIKQMDNDSDKFNPKFLVSNDTAASFIYTGGGVNEFESKDYFRTVHIVSNSGNKNNGALPSIVAAANLLGSSAVNKTASSGYFQNCVQYMNGGIDGTIEKLKAAKMDKEIKEGNYRGALVKIADNYELFDKMFTPEMDALNIMVARNAAEPYFNPYNQSYNPLRGAIEGSSFIVAKSEGYLGDIQNKKLPSGGYSDDYKRARWKSVAIASGIDLVEYNPAKESQNPNGKIIALFDDKTFREGKQKNKEYLQKTLSKENQGLNKNYNLRQTGYLDEKKDAFLALSISKSDLAEDGVDILVDAAATFLENNQNAKLILSVKKSSEDESLKRFSNIAEKYKGRAVLLEGNLQKENQFFASSDVLVIPNRVAPSNVFQMKAARYGAVPVGANVGATKDIIAPKDDIEKAFGFKASVPLDEVRNSGYELSKVMSLAYKMHDENEPLWENITKNAMNSADDISKSAKEYKKAVFDNPIADTDIVRFYSLDDKVYRGSQPGRCKGGNVNFTTNLTSLDKDMEFLQKQGFTTLIDFRKKDFEGEYPRIEGEYARKHGINHVHIPLDGGTPPTREELDKFFGAIDNSKGKVMFHCRAGVDRTGMMASVYMTTRMGLEPEEAMKKSFDDVGLPRFYYMEPKTREKMKALLQNLHDNEPSKKI